MHKHYNKFCNIDAQKIKHLLQYMTLNKNQTEFEHYLDDKQTYNDCGIVYSMDDKTNLEALQNKFDFIKNQHEKLCKQHNNLHNKHWNLIKQNKMHNSIEYQMDNVFYNLSNNKLSKHQCHKLMRSALNEVRVNDEGRLKFDIGTCNTRKYLHDI